MPKITLKEFLYKFTAIPQNFIDEYYKFYELCENNKFGIPIDKVIKYLNISNQPTFKERIRNSLTMSIDYMIIRHHHKSVKGIKNAQYMLSFEGF